jgi:hypothetical protein
MPDNLGPAWNRSSNRGELVLVIVVGVHGLVLG